MESQHDNTLFSAEDVVVIILQMKEIAWTLCLDFLCVGGGGGGTFRPRTWWGCWLVYWCGWFWFHPVWAETSPGTALSFTLRAADSTMHSKPEQRMAVEVSGGDVEMLWKGLCHAVCVCSATTRWPKSPSYRQPCALYLSGKTTTTKSRCCGTRFTTPTPKIRLNMTLQTSLCQVCTSVWTSWCQHYTVIDFAFSVAYICCVKHKYGGYLAQGVSVSELQNSSQIILLASGMIMRLLFWVFKNHFWCSSPFAPSPPDYPLILFISFWCFRF